MTASTPHYAPTSPRECLPWGARWTLRLRRRARERWTVQALLDERAEMLATLTGLEQMQTKLTTKARTRVADKPSARVVIEDMLPKMQSKFDRGAEILRHRLRVGDGVLSTRGVRPWEDEQS